MEAFIFLAATVSRSFISHPPDHCWPLVTLASLDLGIFISASRPLCRSALHSEFHGCPDGKKKSAGAVILVLQKGTQQKQKPNKKGVTVTALCM